MAEFLNLQVNGAPIVMYSMIGITTAVLAYATAGGEFGNFAASTVGALSPENLTGSVASLGNLDPFGSSTKTASESSSSMSTESDATQNETGQNETGQNETATTQPEPDQNKTPETTGGKKRRKKTPKKRRSAKHRKTKKTKHTKNTKNTK